MAVAAALADWWAVARRSKPVEYAAKPAVLVLLVVVALALDPDDGTQRGWFVVALVLSLAGDVFLMLPRNLFVPGLAAFLLAHLAYVVGLSYERVGEGELALAAAGVALVAVVLGRVVVAGARRHDPALTVPVVAYVVAISAMVASALATGDALAAGGAVLFYASDFFIGWNRFVRPSGWAPLAIIVTYHLGQAGLVASLTR